MMVVSWILDYFPPWLAIVLVTTGSVLITWGLPFVDPKSDFAVEAPKGVFGTLILGIGTGFTIWGARKTASFDTVVVGIILLGLFMQGAVAVNFYRKVYDFVSNGSLPSSGGFRRKIIAHLLILFLLLIALWTIIYFIIWGNLDLGIQDTVRLYWTIATVIISVLGLSTRFWFMQRGFPPQIMFGGIFLITGAEIFNLQFEVELTTFVLSHIVYTLGFWIAAFLFVSSVRNSNRTHRR
ncbi:hypothetical protein C444_08680 [Haloarcula japonica DSM 6131]|uniref:Uncharacterized protein n=2 Tax=Haloarcula japonica TaxID=29282 RepID=M0LBM8_HALJT|nr:hypothetical protein C444_08680 [Haloarcula japonica DSM 6131]